METVGELRKRFDRHLMRRPIRAVPAFVDDGLVLGADTCIFAVDTPLSHDDGLIDDESGRRLLALLRSGYGFPITPGAVAIVRRAATQWSRGEQALAHIHLAFARLPRLPDREAAFRLFLADEVLRAGVTPEALMAALVPSELDKFDSDQPRVPAGSGRESGQWTSGGGGARASEIEPVVTGRSAIVEPPSSGVTARPYSRPDPSAAPFTLTSDDKWRECHNMCLVQTEGVWPDSNRPGLYRRCMRECLGPNVNY